MVLVLEYASMGQDWCFVRGNVCMLSQCRICRSVQILVNVRLALNITLTLILSYVFQSLIISKIRYGLPVWGGYVNASQKKQIALLGRFFKCWFTSRLWELDIA